MKTVMMSLYTERHGIQRGKKEGGCDWKVSGYFLVSPDIVNSEGIAKSTNDGLGYGKRISY